MTVFADADNRIGCDGIADIAEALKVNSTLVDVSLQGKVNLVMFFIPLSFIREQELQ